MKGIVLGFDSTNGGFIRADDGKRYVLASNEWRGAYPPHAGEEVDFEINDNAASEVYPLVNATTTTQESFGKTLNTVGKALAVSVSRAATEASNRLSESSNSASVGGADLPSHPIIQKIHRHGKIISASMFALILICFFLKFVTISYEYRPFFELSYKFDATKICFLT